MLTKGFRWFNKTHPKPNLLLSVNPFFLPSHFFLAHTNGTFSLVHSDVLFTYYYFSISFVFFPTRFNRFKFRFGFRAFKVLCTYVRAYFIQRFFFIRCYGICVKMKSYYNIILFKQLYSQIFASAWSLNFNFSETSKYLIATVGSVLYLDEKKIEWAHRK